MTVESEMENGPTSVEKYQYTSYKPFIAAKPEVFEVINYMITNALKNI